MTKAFYIGLFALFALVVNGQIKDGPSDVSAIAREAISVGHTAWRKDGGAEFMSGLTYVNGEPILMMYARVGETADQTTRRLYQMVAACDFLLDESAVGQARICVVTVDSKDPRKQRVVNYEPTRALYKGAVLKVTGLIDSKLGLAKAKTDKDTLAAACKELGFN
jgi:hypothetical protein